MATSGEKAQPYSEVVERLEDVVKKLETAVKKAMEAQEFKTTAENQEVTILYMDSKQYDRHLKEKWPRTEKDFKMMGIIKEAATQPY